MVGSAIKLVAYMQGSNKRFVIPVYQRNYDWKTENCKQLYDDLIKVIKSGRKSHFFGSIVSVYDPDGEHEEFLVIDGQQRLTTVSILFLAMHNALENGIVKSNKSNLSDKIFKEFLVDEWADEETRIKLKPIKNDNAAFDKLFENSKEHIRDSNITINYNYFYDRIQKEEITIDELFTAISKLEIINISLNNDDNPQLIFESLNSTGVGLSEGDKIRNYILMGLPTKTQNKYYNDYWNKIETNTLYGVSDFIRDYLSIKQQSIPSKNRVYFNFKEYVETKSIETEDLLVDLVNYSQWYKALLTGEEYSYTLKSCIKRLNRLETTVTRPFFLEVLRLKDENKLTLGEVEEIFLLTENYLFRRSICDLNTNSLNKIFLTLHKEIVKYDGTENDYVEKFKYAILSKKERTRCPDDDEFIKAFCERQVYLMNSKNKLYILERLENYGTKEDKEVYAHIDSGDYTVEHIMPQHLTPMWKKDLGNDYEVIHEEWLHRIANLTLTAYNSKYSNNTFIEKKSCKNGFADSGIRMNTYLAKLDKWTLRELEERNNYLGARALEIWKMPSTAFKPAEKQLDSCSLDDDADLINKNIVKFSFKNTEYPVTSWVEMYVQVLKILYSEDESIIIKLACDDEDDMLHNYISNSSNSFKNPIEISEGVYIYKNTNTRTKVTLLTKLFELYNEDPSDLIFYFRDDEDTNAQENEAKRFELRKDYWTFALPIIQESNLSNGMYKNVSPSKDNWINGFIGISGFFTCCTANYTEAKVSLLFFKSKKEENKEAFDLIYKHKNEIEEKLGVNLTWDRGEDKKSSGIIYSLKNVNLEDETDWVQMAKFHAEWTKKFYDVLVPYLFDAGY